MRLTIMTAALFLGTSLVSVAQVAPNEDGWACGGGEEWETAVLLLAEELTLNNFFFGEKTEYGMKMRTLEIHYSAINRNMNATYHMTGQFVGFDETGGVTFAMSVSPSFKTAGIGTKTARDSVYISGPVLSRTDMVCAAFAIEAKG